jgi:protein-tyrosine sulfotransferase
MKFRLTLFKFIIWIIISIVIVNLLLLNINFIANYNVNNESFGEYDIERIRKQPILFILGHPRSGTTLIRAILDSHSKIFCGPETKIFPTLLRNLNEFQQLAINKNFVQKSFFSFNKLHEATALFMFHFLINNLKRSTILCAHDPHSTIYMQNLHEIFPNAKFVYMIRDGRASVFSYLKYLNIETNRQNYYDYLLKWNEFTKKSYEQCQIIGERQCKIIKYEDLVLDKKNTVKKLANFLNIDFEESSMMNHEKLIGTKIILERDGWSSDQVNKSIYTNSLKSWIGKIDYDSLKVKSDIDMLGIFGYY